MVLTQTHLLLETQDNFLAGLIIPPDTYSRDIQTDTTCTGTLFGTQDILPDMDNIIMDNTTN